MWILICIYKSFIDTNFFRKLNCIARYSINITTIIPYTAFFSKAMFKNWSKQTLCKSQNIFISMVFAMWNKTKNRSCVDISLSLPLSLSLSLYLYLYISICVRVCVRVHLSVCVRKACLGVFWLSGYYEDYAVAPRVLDWPLSLCALGSFFTFLFVFNQGWRSTNVATSHHTHTHARVQLSLCSYFFRRKSFKFFFCCWDSVCRKEGKNQKQ